MSSPKAQAQSMIERLPEDASLEDIQYHLYVLEKLRAQAFEKSAERVKGMTAGVVAARLRGIVRRAVRHAQRRAR